MIRNLRWVSLIEATSYSFLLVATLVKQTGGSEVGVTILGPIHGVLFLVFAALVVVCRTALSWSWSKALMALILGSLPLGGFWIDRSWLAPAEPRLFPGPTNADA